MLAEIQNSWDYALMFVFLFAVTMGRHWPLRHLRNRRPRAVPDAVKEQGVVVSLFAGRWYP